MNKQKSDRKAAAHWRAAFRSRQKWIALRDDTHADVTVAVCHAKIQAKARKP
jgi:hypothetical protein